MLVFAWIIWVFMTLGYLVFFTVLAVALCKKTGNVNINIGISFITDTAFYVFMTILIFGHYLG